jgi:hypothetical protein
MPLPRGQGEQFVATDFLRTAKLPVEWAQMKNPNTRNPEPVHRRRAATTLFFRTATPCRTRWVGTSGRQPGGAQHRIGSLNVRKREFLFGCGPQNFLRNFPWT